jgi:heat shock protein HslJ
MRKGIRSVVAATLIGMSYLAVGPAAPALPDKLASPDHGVVCNRETGVCFDRFGPSIGLTEIFLGESAAGRLLASLHARSADQRAGAVFSPATGVECVRESGPCRVEGQPHERLTAVLYGPRPESTNLSAEARAVIGAEWQWLGTRYNNDTESRPGHPARYMLRFQADGSVQLQADCNGAGGRYRLDGSRIGIEITHSTLAACEPGSLERVFLRDLAAAAVYFMKAGRLYLDLKYDGGTMEFGRRP